MNATLSFAFEVRGVEDPARPLVLVCRDEFDKANWMREIGEAVKQADEQWMRERRRRIENRALKTNATFHRGRLQVHNLIQDSLRKLHETLPKIKKQRTRSGSCTVLVGRHSATN